MKNKRDGTLIKQSNDRNISECVRLDITNVDTDNNGYSALTSTDTYLQFLHFSPNNIPFPHTMHVWDIQYFVENLQAKRRESEIPKKGIDFSLVAHLYDMKELRITMRGTRVLTFCLS